MSPEPRKWIALAGIAVTCFIVAGSGAGMIGTVLGPVMVDLKWASSTTASLATVYTLGYLAINPVAGAAVDRFGARATMAGGTLMACVGLVWAARCDSLVEMGIAFALAGAGFSASFYTPSGVLIARWMPDNKALGMGLVMGAMAGGAMVFTTLTAWWIEQSGWRHALRAISVLDVVMLSVIGLVISNGPAISPTQSLTERHVASAAAVRRAFASAAFIVATVSGMLFNFGIQAIYYHVVPMLTGAGYAPRQAGLVLGATWLVSAAGSLLLGAVADRQGARLTLAGTLVLGGLGTLLLAGASLSSVGIACAALFVLLWGVASNSFTQIAPVLLAERFGSSHLGSLLGVQFTVSGLMGAAAPVVTGVLYDHFGDFTLAIVLSAAATLLSGVLILLLRPGNVAADACSPLGTQGTGG